MSTFDQTFDAVFGPMSCEEDLSGALAEILRLTQPLKAQVAWVTDRHGAPQRVKSVTGALPDDTQLESWSRCLAAQQSGTEPICFCQAQEGTALCGIALEDQAWLGLCLDALPPGDWNEEIWCKILVPAARLVTLVLTYDKKLKEKERHHKHLIAE